MDAYFVLALAGITSLAAGVLEWRRQSRPGAALRAATGRALETLGLCVIFFLANVTTGALVTAAARLLGLGFVSIYLSTDVALLVLSLLQALVFQGWREARRAA